MITKVWINGLRGIWKGHLNALSPITFLVGPNNSGKSTVLDALHLAGSKWVGTGIVDVLGRRPDLEAPARWLFHRGANDSSAWVGVGAEEPQRSARVDLQSGVGGGGAGVRAHYSGADGLTQYSEGGSLFGTQAVSWSWNMTLSIPGRA